jgi:hypothetical protein
VEARKRKLARSHACMQRRCKGDERKKVKRVSLAKSDHRDGSRLCSSACESSHLKSHVY